MSQSTLERVGALQFKISVKVPAQVLQNSVEQNLRRFQKDAQLKGFRPGKAPIEMIREVYGQRAVAEAVENVVGRSFHEATQEHKVRPYNYPEFEFDPPTLGQDFSFTAHFETLPSIEKVAYEGLVLEKDKPVVTDEDVDKVILNFRKRAATYVEIEENRGAQKDDHVEFDFDGSIDGAKMDKGSAKNFKLQLGSGQLIPDFEAALIGFKKGENRPIKVKFPLDYGEQSLAGKEAEFQINFHKILKEVLGDFSEDTLKALGVESESAFREKTRQDLINSQSKRIKDELRERVFEKLVEKNPIEVPSSLVEDQKKRIVEDYKQRLEQDLGREEAEKMAGQYSDKWATEVEEMARKVVQGSLLVQTLAQSLNLDANDKDIEARFAEISGHTGASLDMIQKYYQSKEGQSALEQMAYRITQDKVVDLVIAAGTVVEVEKPRPKA